MAIAPNSSRSAITNCNKACERVRRFSDLFTPDDTFQQHLLPWLNNDLLPKEDYSYAHEVLITRLKEKYGEEVQSCHAAELEVELNLHTPCKRTLIVPGNLNFYQLHKVLQNAFEWHDCHLHQFVTERDSCGRPVKVIRPADAEQDEFDELFRLNKSDSLDAEVCTVFAAKKIIEYEYDFGDGWVHGIKLKRFIEGCADVYPCCTEAIGDAPMEDCGGPGGFEAVMAIMQDPEHPEHRNVCEWVRSTWWHPVDLEKINRRIRNEHRICMPVY